ncbi:MAG: PilN domain-containing protein [Phycisphaerae bacterium]
MRELEFLPPDYLRARFHRRVGFIRSWLLLAMGLAMVLWSLQMGTWVNDARAELQALRGTGYAVGAEAQKVERLQAEERAYEERLAVLKRLEGPGSVIGLTAMVADVVPAEVVLDEVVLSGCETPNRPTLRITGRSPSEMLVTRLLGSLEMSPSFEGAALVGSKGGVGGGREFVIAVTALPGADAQQEH